MKSSCFPPKNAINQQTSNQVSQSGIRGLVFGGKQLEFMFCLGSQKDMPLTSLYYTWVICHLVLLKSLLDIYFFSLGGARTILCLFISYFPHFLLGFLKWDFPVLKSFPETRRWETKPKPQLVDSLAFFLTLIKKQQRTKAKTLIESHTFLTTVLLYKLVVHT